MLKVESLHAWQLLLSLVLCLLPCKTPPTALVLIFVVDKHCFQMYNNLIVILLILRCLP